MGKAWEFSLADHNQGTTSILKKREAKTRAQAHAKAVSQHTQVRVLTFPLPSTQSSVMREVNLMTGGTSGYRSPATTLRNHSRGSEEPPCAHTRTHVQKTVTHASSTTQLRRPNVG